MKKLLFLPVLMFTLIGCQKPSIFDEKMTDNTEITNIQDPMTKNDQVPNGLPSVAPDSEGRRRDQDPMTKTDNLVDRAELYYPISNYEQRLTFKKFGQTVNDRFNGYHTGDDLEVTKEELTADVPIYSMAEGVVVYKSRLSGYGGVLVLEYQINGETIQNLYGHLDLSRVRPNLGDHLAANTIIGYLGDDKSEQTDGERKHLHFSLYKGSRVKTAGYVTNPTDLGAWLNPAKFLADAKAAPANERLSAPIEWQKLNLKTQNANFNLSLRVPRGWQIQLVPEIEAISLFDPTIPASNDLEKSLLFIRYFDSEEFLTLSTVSIINRRLLTINNHEAIEYLIQKRGEVRDFANQPNWRNRQHVVTDIRSSLSSRDSRFYVIAQNPALDPIVYEHILDSLEFPQN